MRRQNTEHKSIVVPLDHRLILTVKEASEYSGLTEKEVIKQMRKWNCKFFVRVGRARMIKRRQFDEYIDQNRNSTNEPPIWEKELLTLDEAAAYTNIGTKRLRDLISEEGCGLVKTDNLQKQIIREKLEEFAVKTKTVK